MDNGSLELSITNSPENRDHIEDEPKGVLKMMIDGAELNVYFKILE